MDYNLNTIRGGSEDIACIRISLRSFKLIKIKLVSAMRSVCAVHVVHKKKKIRLYAFCFLWWQFFFFIACVSCFGFVLFVDRIFDAQQ